MWRWPRGRDKGIPDWAVFCHRLPVILLREVVFETFTDLRAGVHDLQQHRFQILTTVGCQVRTDPLPRCDEVVWVF